MGFAAAGVAAAESWRGGDPQGDFLRLLQGGEVAPRRSGRDAAVVNHDHPSMLAVQDRIVTGDCLEVLAALPPGFAELVFADPPFNIGLTCAGYDDRLSRDEYLGFTDRC
jgi:hypothetical protein